MDKSPKVLRVSAELVGDKEFKLLDWLTKKGYMTEHGAILFLRPDQLEVVEPKE